MVAETLSDTCQVLLDKLTDEFLSDHTCCLWGVEIRVLIQKLQCSILLLKEILLYVEEHQRYAPPELQKFVREVKDVLNEADDMLNDITAQKSKMDCIGRKVRRCCSSSLNSPVLHRGFASKIRAIIQTLDELEADFHRFHDTSVSTTFDTHWGRQSRETTSYVNPSEIIGREEYKEKIIQLILTQPTGEELGVIPIVGIGGIGKTTLAQLVFHDERVEMHFQLRVWVCVATRTTLEEYVRPVVESEEVVGKRYLLVLDDVRDIDPQTWSSLKDLLKKMGRNGSRIIVTTRRNDVAEMMGTVPPFGLEGLSSQDSLSLFHQLLRHEDEVFAYEEIGKEIVTKCGGVPLAVKQMADTLYNKNRYWEILRDCEIWEFPEFRYHILFVLKRSYDDMPSHLRLCFQYCSFFPKGYEFDSFELIQFWEASGLINSKATGMECLRGLLSFCLLKECKGEAAFCFKYKMAHQLIHDLARWLVLDQADTTFSMVKRSIQVPRYLFVSSKLFGQRALGLLDDNMGSIQTLSFADKVEKSVVELFIQRCQLLRVLILRISGLKVLPRGIKGLKSLEYLDLNGNKGVKEIPNFICMLQSLETLILEGCTAVEVLPRDIKNLSHLTMLSITTKQTFLPENGVGRLGSLRYLAIIGCPNLKYLPQGIHLLTSLTTLIIRDCNSLTSLPRSMKYLIVLETLVIAKCPELHLSRKVEGEGYLNAIGLSLHRCCLTSLPWLSELPQWLVRKSAQTLKSLHIEDCQSFEFIPYWFTEELTSLEELEILNCGKLSHQQGIKPFNALDKIKVEGCPNLTEQNLSNQSASTSKINNSSIEGVQGGNSRMEKGKEVWAENERESFETAEGATSSMDGAGPSSISSVITPFIPNAKGRKPAQGLATILSIGTANPANYILQDDFIDYYFRVTKSEHMTQVKDKFKRICDKAKVRKRHFVSTEEMIFENPNISTYDGNSLAIRHQIITSEVPKLALEAASKAIEEWGQPKSHITHLIFAAVSGVDMPGADYRLTRLLGLPVSVKRTVMMYFQGTYASGTILRTAKDIAENNTGSRVLVVSSHVSIGTFRGPNESDTPSLIANATMGDGAAALIIGADLDGSKERPLLQIVSASENIVLDSDGATNGDVHEAGLSLYLTEDVPKMIATNIENSLKEALSPINVTDWNSFFWIIHPGGNPIIDQIETKLGLKKENLWATRYVLREFGNMSGATVFFALDEMRRKSVEAVKATTGEGLEWGILFGLGAGITIDTVVLRSFATNAIC